MNPITKAVDHAKFTIPSAILNDVFIPYSGYKNYNAYTNLDEQIIQQVIRARVMIDCDLVGGTQVIVPLGELPMDKPTPYETVFRVPKERTQGRRINSVLNVSFISPAAVTNLSATLPNYNASRVAGSLMNNVQALLSSFDTAPVVSTARCDLIGENVIVVRDNIVLSTTAFLRCVLANDEEMANIQMRSYLHFAKLCEYAIKSYIYNKLVISLDQGKLQNGYDLGAYKDVVMGFADAEQNYQDYLREQWEAIAFMNDGLTYNRFITLAIGAGK